MGCAYAERLRNVALVSISRELRTITKRHRSGNGHADPSVRGGSIIILLRKKTDQDRKALQDHLTHCRRCRNTEEQNASELGGPQEPQVQES